MNKRYCKNCKYLQRESAFGYYKCRKQNITSLDLLKHLEDKERYIKAFDKCLSVAKLVMSAKELTEQEIKDIGIDLVEENFPKGECKERGKAIVLYARLLIKFKEVYAKKCLQLEYSNSEVEKFIKYSKNLEQQLKELKGSQ